MSDTPIHSFFIGMSTFHPHDVAVLLGMVAAQEMSGGAVINPGVQRRLWSVELGSGELSDSIGRLEGAGEVERVMCPDDSGDGGMVLAGFRVVRFDQLQDWMTEFGRRRYNRIKQREHKARKESETV